MITTQTNLTSRHANDNYLMPEIALLHSISFSGGINLYSFEYATIGFDGITGSITTRNITQGESYANRKKLRH